MTDSSVPAKTPRTTISDVARQAGVSVTTVSHALNGRGQVDPATRRRVEETALQLGYRPNRHAQRLRGGGTSMIALMSSMPFAVAGGPSRLGFMMEVASVAAASALERGMAMVLVPPLESGRSPLDVLDVDGALLIEPSAADRQLADLTARGLPVVSIGKPGGSAFDDIPYVDLQSGTTVQMLLAHLLARGARHIALVLGTAERTSYAQADAAYASMVEERGMASVVLRMDESRGEAGGRDAARTLLAAYPQIDAFLVLVDVFAVGAAQYLQQAGLRVPQDIMLATRYDGLRARTCEPPLTAVNLHLDQVARQAIDLLFERLRGDAQRLRADSPMPEIVARASTARLQG
ncbi:LacI family DNA-binding transcriptional regulator [Comamonas odontotermitis]|uniref:LacI family DNA-binding transcriptional regulator n=1 Tax=Comamonas odontotermitis TaxID=379895 RepID=UPI003753C6F1